VAPSVHPLRFFRVVTTLPPLILWTFAVVVLVGAAAIVRDPSRSVGVMVPVLLLQLFAASSGFEVPARRGHYDLLLTSGHPRKWIALVHWGTSIAPGVVSWLALAIVESVASPGLDPRLLRSGTAVAMGLVSTLPWAITVRLPRFSGGIGWLLALAMWSSVWSADVVTTAQSKESIGEALWSAWGFLVYPAGLVGHDLSPGEGLIAAPAVVLAVGSMAAACRWVSRAGVPLEAAQ
jgi:hypothetical protein